MIDVKFLLRKAYYTALNGNLANGATNVPVFDTYTSNSDNSVLYVLITSMDGSDKPIQNGFRSDEKIQLEVIYKAAGRADRLIIDTIAGQIFNILQPTPGAIGLPAQAGISITCLNKTMDRDMSMVLGKASSIARRVIVYSQKVSQT